MKRGLRRAGLALLPVAFCCSGATGQAPPNSPTACDEAQTTSALAAALALPGGDAGSSAIRRTLDAVDARDFPELHGKRIGVGKFQSEADYFRTRFSLWRFLLPVPMKYSVQVNPRIFRRDPPPQGVCAILGHESAHLVALSHGNRIRRFGLLRLLSGGYTAKFERRADLDAIRRGFGPGLKAYREWVYKNIPARRLATKKRNYFSPEEIAAIAELGAANPSLFAVWQRHVPLSLEEIRQSAAATVPAKP